MTGDWTFTSPSVYLAYDSINAGGPCYTGNSHSNGLLTLHPSELSSVVYHSATSYASGDNYKQSRRPFNLADLQGPVPAMAYYWGSPCNDSRLILNGCEPTIMEGAYYPMVAIPTAVTHLDPFFANCWPFRSEDRPLKTPNLAAVWDPPTMLTATTALPVVTLPKFVIASRTNTASSILDPIDASPQDLAPAFPQPTKAPSPGNADVDNHVDSRPHHAVGVHRPAGLLGAAESIDDSRDLVEPKAPSSISPSLANPDSNSGAKYNQDPFPNHEANIPPNHKPNAISTLSFTANHAQIIAIAYPSLNKIEIGSSTLQRGGPPAVISGETMSVNSKGQLIVGGTRTIDLANAISGPTSLPIESIEPLSNGSDGETSGGAVAWSTVSASKKKSDAGERMGIFSRELWYLVCAIQVSYIIFST
jgi:hypothetical protein